MIHSTAIINERARIGKNVSIGPYCVIGDEVELHDGVELKSHVVIEGKTTIGEKTVIFPFASIGHRPQDKKYNNEPSDIIIGKNNIIREYVTIQPGTSAGKMRTSVGDSCLLMVGVHIAHNCQLGNGVICANYTNLGGHVEVGDYANLGGMVGVHQFVRIGQHAMIGGGSILVRDLIPFGMAVNERAYLEGLNLIGMRRYGFRNEVILEANAAIARVFSSDTSISSKINQLGEDYKNNVVIEQIVKFLNQDSSRSFCFFRQK